MDIEQVTFTGNVTIPAGDVSGATAGTFGENGAFQGLTLLDYDEIVDRNEELMLLQASHVGYCYIKSTGTADGTARAILEVSASPSRSAATQGVGAGGDADGLQDWDTGNLLSVADREDSIDVIGRPMLCVGFQAFSDGGTGVGGAGTSAPDSVEVEDPPETIGRFHPRDELFLNGSIEVQNVTDASITVDVMCQHIYGVVEQ